MEVLSPFDVRLRDLKTSGNPVLLERSATDGAFTPPRVLDDVSACVATLGLCGHHPVMVIVGGAAVMDTADLRQDGKLANELRRSMDLAIVSAAEAAGAVVLTGGTNQGVMKMAGECFADRGAMMLVGVAPRAKVVVAPAAGAYIAADQALLDPNHQHFVLTSGEEWGAETDTLFDLAEQIAGDQRAGVVVLANGGAVARHEAKRFLESGWPVITLAGTRRAADDLAQAWRRPSGLNIRRRRTRARLRQDWGRLDAAQVEVHELLHDPVQNLSRTLAWHLSGRHLLKNAFGTWASYDAAASTGRRLTTRVQGFALGLAAILTVGSLIYGVYIHSGPLGELLATLPVLVALNGSMLDFLLPRRNWMVMRSAAQTAERAIYRYRAACASGLVAEDTDPPLVRELAAIRQYVLSSGVRNLVAPPAGRPTLLSNAYDELGALTAREYTTIRLDGQLAYYRAAAARLQRFQLSTVAAGALLAALATWASAQVHFALWVPVLVLLGATLVIAQQRARWQDRVALYAAALANLQALRDRAYSQDARQAINILVNDVEDALEDESSGWLQNLSQSAALPPFIR